jgi:hypothetical protein
MSSAPRSHLDPAINHTCFIRTSKLVASENEQARNMISSILIVLRKKTSERFVLSE